jgi:hypothetical protein
MQKKSVALIIILSGLIGYYTMLLSAQWRSEKTEGTYRLEQRLPTDGEGSWLIGCLHYLG